MKKPVSLADILEIVLDAAEFDKNQQKEFTQRLDKTVRLELLEELLKNPDENQKKELGTLIKKEEKPEKLLEYLLSQKSPEEIKDLLGQQAENTVVECAQKFLSACTPDQRRKFEEKLKRLKN